MRCPSCNARVNPFFTYEAAFNLPPACGRCRTRLGIYTRWPRLVAFLCFAAALATWVEISGVTRLAPFTRFQLPMDWWEATYGACVVAISIALLLGFFSEAKLASERKPPVLSYAFRGTLSLSLLVPVFHGVVVPWMLASDIFDPVRSRPPLTSFGPPAPLDYRGAMFAELPRRALLSFEGKVAERDLDGDGFLAYTKAVSPKGEYRDDPVYLEFRGQAKLLVGDIVHIRGQYKGITRLLSTDGRTLDVPRILVDHYSVNLPLH